MLLHQALPENVLPIVQNMRSEDAREIYATRWDNDPIALATAVMRCGDKVWTAHNAGNDPIAVIGGAPLHPNVWTVFMFATDQFHQIAFPLTKYVKRTMIPGLLIEVGAHRAECNSIEGHTVAHNWLRHLGLKEEGPVMKAYGRDGEDFIKFVWTLDNVLQATQDTGR